MNKAQQKLVISLSMVAMLAVLAFALLGTGIVKGVIWSLAGFKVADIVWLAASKIVENNDD